jgi:hypothetical protein
VNDTSSGNWDRNTVARVATQIHSSGGRSDGMSPLYYWLRNKNNSTTAIRFPSNHHSGNGGGTPNAAVATDNGIRPAMILHFPTLDIAPMHRNTYIKDFETFSNVVSAVDTETYFRFKLPDGYSAGQTVVTTEKGRFEYHEVWVDELGNVNHEEDTGFTRVVERRFASAASAVPLTYETEISGYYSIAITADYEGVIKVVVAAGGIEQEFYLDIVPLNQFVASPTTRDSHQWLVSDPEALWLHVDGSHFIADSWLWRIVNRNLGSGQILALSEYNYANAVQWNNGNANNLAFTGSPLYTSTLPSYYPNFAWAHSYALAPTIDGSWGAAANTGATVASAGSPATSGNALFLLSSGDMNNTAYFSNNNARIAYSIHSTRGGTSVAPGSIGTPQQYWLRNKSSANNVYSVSNSGAVANAAITAATQYAVRPAMILRIDYE